MRVPAGDLMAGFIVKPDARESEPAPADAVPSAPTRRVRALGAAARVAGLVGIAICLLLIVVTLVARGWVVARVDEAEATIDGGLARGATLLASATQRVAEVGATVGKVGASAEAVSSAARPSGALVQALLGDVTNLSQRYLDARAAYAQARETIVDALARLETIDQLLPGVALPNGPVDALSALDESLRALDARIMEVVRANPAAGSVQAWSRVVAEGANRVGAALDEVSGRLAAADARLAGMRSDLAAAADRIAVAATLVTIGAILLLLYLALLHWVLYRAGRDAHRAATVSSAAAPAAPSSHSGDDDPVPPGVT
jgi:hypothetical protein